MIQIFDKFGKLKSSGIPGFGTVTSVSSGNLSPLFTSSVTSSTSTPNITFAPINQAQKLFYASPNGSTGTPSFRAIQASDLPSLSGIYVPVSRNLTINGVTYDLSADRTWTIATTTTWGSITGTLTAQTDLTLYLSSNFYPLSTNPAGYITSSALSPYLTTAAAALTYCLIPAVTISQYIDGTGALQSFPSIPAVDATPTDGSSNAVSSNGVFDALALKANLLSPALTGSPTAPTQTANDNSTKIATTAYADAKVTDTIVNGVTNVAPSQNAVFDALALKADSANVEEIFDAKGYGNWGQANNSTAEEVLRVIDVPGGYYTPTDSMSMLIRLLKLSNTGNMTLRVRVGVNGNTSDALILTTTVATGGNSPSILMQRNQIVFDASNIYIASISQSLNTDLTNGSYGTFSNVSLNTANNWKITITCQTDNNTQSIILRHYKITKFKNK